MAPEQSADLHVAQDQLGRALDRARVGEDRQLAAEVRDLGEQVVRLLTGLLRMTRTHAGNNAAFTEPVRQVCAALARLHDVLGAVHLVAVEDQVYVNDIRIRMDSRAVGGTADLAADLRRHRVGGVSFHEPLTPAELRAVVFALSAGPAAERPRSAVRARLAEAAVTSVQLPGVFRFRVTGEQVDQAPVQREAVEKKAMDAAVEVWAQMSAGRLPNPLPVRRAVTDLLQANDESRGLFVEGDGASPYASHVLRVTQLALWVGQALGLQQEALQDLGVAAMFHDVGYAAREGATVDHPGFAPPFERHAAAGARLLLAQRGFHPAKIRRALATLEHHRDFSNPSGRPWLFGRILRICEDYDTYVRHEVNVPAEVLAGMSASVGRRYDPVLLQLLVNVLGRFPPGTMLKLADGRKVRSISGARDQLRWARPLCLMVQLANGLSTDKRVLVDLAQESVAVVSITR